MVVMVVAGIACKECRKSIGKVVVEHRDWIPSSVENKVQ